MSNNETRLREALERMLYAVEEHPFPDIGKTCSHARQVLQETAPEPPKHPAQVGWAKQITTVIDYDKEKAKYMQGFKDALLWAAEQTYNKTPVPELNLSTRQAQFLKETANTVPQ